MSGSDQPQRQVLRLHGRDHLPGGSDPIPRLRANPMPWLLFQGDLDGFTAPSPGSITDAYPELTGLLVNPLNAGGTVDPAVYGGIDPGDSPIPVMDNLGNSNEPFKAIQILQPGLYYFEFGMTWYYDWTEQEAFAERYATVRQNITHSDGDTSVIATSSYGLSSEQTYIGLPPEGTDFPMMPLAFQLTARTYIAIDERAIDVRLNAFINNFNEVGADRTYNNTDRTGSLTFFVVRLTPSGHSNPGA